MFLSCALREKKEEEESRALHMLSKWPSTHHDFSYIWSLEDHTNSRLFYPLPFFPFFSNWYVTNDEIFRMKVAIGASIFLYDLLSGPALLQAINKNATFICISNWGESVKIKHFHFCLSITHSLCAPKTARHTSHCLSSRMISWKGHKNNLLLAYPQHV